MKELAAVVIAKNEQVKIRECLSALKWTDEIVVVDTGSTDKTVDIAKTENAKVVIAKSNSFAGWRNEGMAATKCKWVLYIDADERVDEKLREEIRKTISNSPKFAAYALPRKNFIFGREFRHTGQWPDYVKRLFKKTEFDKWTGELHEEPNYYHNGKLTKGDDITMGKLANPLIHYKHDNLGEMIDKTNNWSEIEAKLMYKAGHPGMNIPRFLTAMGREFWLRMIRQRAFLDGGEGIIYAMYQVYSRFISYAKLWEMQEVGNKK